MNFTATKWSLSKNDLHVNESSNILDKIVQYIFNEALESFPSSSISLYRIHPKTKNRIKV